MKKFIRISMVVLFVSTVVVSLAFLPSLQAKEQMDDQLGHAAKREELRMKMELMRAEIVSNGYTFTVDFNPAMQYTIEQLCNFKPELAPAESLDQDPLGLIAVKPTPPPEDTYYIADYTKVKDQGSCGSCWAFSTAGMFESVLLKQGINTDLSEQWLVSCNDDGWGCNGGWFANSYYLNPGAVLEKCFRYKALDLPCKDCPSVYVASSSKNVSGVDSIKNAIKTYGGVSCAVTVTYYFQAYSGGVFNYDSNSPTNHAVVLVGWDDELGAGGAWRMKNSWGTSWGEGGMMWIEYGCSNIGSGSNYLTY
jgi:hypothetical protein